MPLNHQVDVFISSYVDFHLKEFLDSGHGLLINLSNIEPDNPSENVKVIERAGGSERRKTFSVIFARASAIDDY